MKLIPHFDGTRIKGIRFAPESPDEEALIRAFSANGTERQNGDIVMRSDLVYAGKPGYGIVVTYLPAITPPVVETLGRNTEAPSRSES